MDDRDTIMDDRDTIFALSSGRPPVAIAVVRVSGPRAKIALETLAGRLPPPRRASLAKLRDPVGGHVLDDALMLWLPGPKSETAEDMAELHLHGGRAVIAAVLGALGRVEGLRPAQAGEFTRRAFENGRLDLTAVEGLADFIHAETEGQRRQAYRQMSGVLGERAEAWRARLIEAIALVEAGIDFPDEGDVPQDLVPQAVALARDLHSEIGTALDSSRRSERLREGLVVAIVGPPNAGKSSLLNRIARREAAIVTPYAGTTRDVIEVHLDLEGYPVTLLDTAGLREAEDPAEQEGVRRARARAAEADLVLWVADAAAADETGLTPKSVEGETWLIVNKIDLVDSYSEHSHTDRFGPGKVFSVSARNGQGLEDLLAGLGSFAAGFFSGVESALMSRERHRTALQACREALQRAVELGVDHEDLIAEDLRLAARELGRLTGRVDAEDVLDLVFRNFCIGK